MDTPNFTFSYDGFKRQNEEIDFFKEKHPHLPFVENSNFSLEIFTQNDLLLNQYNSEIIHQAVLRQSGRKLTLTGITRFIIPEQDVEHFSKLKELEFKGDGDNLLRHLDAVGVPSLSKLFCEYNDLKELNIPESSDFYLFHHRGNPSLKMKRITTPKEGYQPLYQNQCTPRHQLSPEPQKNAPIKEASNRNKLS